EFKAKSREFIDPIELIAALHSVGVNIRHAEKMPMHYALAFLHARTNFKHIMGRQQNTPPNPIKPSTQQGVVSSRKVSSKRVCQ
ncbi:MAG: hypothetical protein RSA84_14270, partial [Acinetobacter sp.]